MSVRPLTSTRARLLAAAQELIETGGYGAASVLAIADRAGVAAGTLYRHFTSKEELFACLFRTVCDREVAAMAQAAEQMAPDAGQAERLEMVLATFARRALRRPRLAWALIAEPVDPLVDAERLAYRARYASLIAEGAPPGDRGRRAAGPGRRSRRRGAGRRLRRGARRAALPAGRRAARRGGGPVRAAHVHPPGDRGAGR